MIHPTAIIHPAAQLGRDVRVGPFAVIDADVSLGDGCVLGPYVYLTGHTSIGAGNVFHAGCVIGDAPQDLKYKKEPTRLRIGDANTFRENVTVHRSNKLEEDTVVGSNNLLMAGAHVAHNCLVGHHVILANGVCLGGHAVVQDRAFLSGNCLVHQFTRVGTLAMLRGGAAVSQDVPPFCTAAGENHVCGLNVVGLRRAGITLPERMELKRLYHALFRSVELRRTILARALTEFSSAPARLMLEFVGAAKRGVCSDRGRRAAASAAGEGDN